MRVGGVLDAPVLQVAVHPRLVDRAERAEAHRDGRELPEVRHQPRVRVAGEAVGGLRLLLAEGVELLLGEPVQQERAGVDAGGGVTLEEDLVAGLALGVLAPEEVVEADVVERRGGGEGGDVPTHADAGALRPGDHHRGVPAGRVEDLALDLLVTGEERLVLGGDGVDVVRAAHLGHGDTLLAGALDQPQHQVTGTLAPPLVDGRIERLQPFRGLLGIEVRDLTRKAANDDRVAIGSGSHAVPSLSVETEVCRAASIVLPRSEIRHLYRSVTVPPNRRNGLAMCGSDSVVRAAHLRVLRTEVVRPGFPPVRWRTAGVRANRRLYARARADPNAVRISGVRTACGPGPPEASLSCAEKGKSV